MDNIIGQQICNHLEFMGYTITDESREDLCKFEAKISEWSTPNLGLVVNNDGFVFIECSYGWWNENIINSHEFHNFINMMNKSSQFNRWSLR